MSFRRQKTWEEEKTRQFDQRQKGPSYHRLPYRVLARAENGDWSIALPVFTYACDYFPTFSLRIEKGCVNQISSAVPKLLVSYRLTNLANTPPALVLPQTSAWLLLLAPILQPTNTLWTFQTPFTIIAGLALPYRDLLRVVWCHIFSTVYPATKMPSMWLTENQSQSHSSLSRFRYPFPWKYTCLNQKITC